MNNNVPFRFRLKHVGLFFHIPDLLGQLTALPLQYIC